jgi:hypothetical protein
MAAETYPMWKFYPSRSPAPAWAERVIAAFAKVQSQIDSRVMQGVASDVALAALRPHLIDVGFQVESSKAKVDKISRPVLFGEVGRSVVAYEVDGFHPEEKVVFEIEAGRGAANNADYRDLIRTSLMVDADYLVLAMMLRYTSGEMTVRSYDQTRDRIDAIFASDRLRLPLKGILLVGY